MKRFQYARQGVIGRDGEMFNEILETTEVGCSSKRNLKSPASRPDIRVAGEYNELRIGAN